MANGWIKYFTDNTQEIGSDQAVSARAASWRHGRLSGMVGTSVEYDGFTLRLSGLGTYWQSDTMEVAWPNTHASTLRRRISRYINPQDTLVRYRIRDNEMVAVFNQELDEGRCILIPKPWHNKWFVLEYELSTRKPRFYVSDKQI